MRWLLPVGVFLIAIGLGGSIGAWYQTSESRVVPGVNASESLEGGVPAQAADEPSRAPLLIAPLAGLALALGLGLAAVGVGHWRRPVPSNVRPANPWSDQPAEKGDPPIGLV
ncbi:MAG: hypothetical protein AB7Q16_11830 [Vicinamibacterales bacterium]